MQQSDRRSIKDFNRNERGTVAILFAVLLVPLITVVSMAIDYGRALKVNSQLTAAADAATAAVLHRLPAEADDLKPWVRTQLDANLPAHLKNLPFSFKISEKQRVIEIAMETDVPTALLALVGVSKLDVAIVSTQRIPKSKPQQGIPGLPNGNLPSNPQQAEEAMRSIARSLGSGNGATGGKTPDPEKVKKAMEELNRKILEAMQKSGQGNIDMEQLKSALGG